MHGRTEDDAIGLLHLLDPLVDLIILDAALVLVLEALAASKTAPDCLVADMHDLRFNSCPFQFIRNHPDGMIGIAVFVGTAIECYRLHTWSSCL